jgi:hypothetical protein
MLEIMNKERMSEFAGYVIDTEQWGAFKSWVKNQPEEYRASLSTSTDWEAAWESYEYDFQSWSPDLVLPLKGKEQVLAYLSMLPESDHLWKTIHVPNQEYRIVLVPKPTKENTNG